MKGNIEERACRLALYIIENKATVRGAAKKFGVSKSTVHTVVPIGVAGITALSFVRNSLGHKGKRASDIRSPLLFFCQFSPSYETVTPGRGFFPWLANS